MIETVRRFFVALRFYRNRYTWRVAWELARNR